MAEKTFQCQVNKSHLKKMPEGSMMVPTLPAARLIPLVRGKLMCASRNYRGSRH